MTNDDSNKTSKNTGIQNFFSGFSKLTFEERLNCLVKAGFISEDSRKLCRENGLKNISLAEKFIENAISYMQLPLGVATNFQIDGEDFFIPMAVEETSIIAAASKTAKWVREQGSISTGLKGVEIIGQIQIAKVKSIESLREALKSNEAHWVKIANDEVASGMVRRGGGVTRISLREIARPDGRLMAIFHVHMNAMDAMGANIMNQVCEFLKAPIEQATQETVTMCILSNLVDTRLTWVKIEMLAESEEQAEKIAEASLFAELDPYRAATNNKGILNGIDPILIATGNDWRAVEAGSHAFAARSGQYQSLSRWRNEGRRLIGVMELPLIVGTVGGVTALHPMARMSLEMLKNPSAARLSQIAASVGLVQNLGALRALTSVGIIEGHMRLHLKNLSLVAGAKEPEMPQLLEKLEKIFAASKKISTAQVIQALTDLRGSSTHTRST